MTLLRASLCVAFLVSAACLACRDAASNPTRPNFSLAQDTIPGGCEKNACTFHSSGDAAFVSWSEAGTAVSSDTGGGGGGGTVRFGNASVSRGGTSDNQQSFLSYGVTECGPFFCNTVASGFGLIPNEDFSVQGGKYRLSTNTANNPDFFTFAGVPGQVTVEWTGNALFRREFNGTSTVTTADFRERQAGSSDEQSANATGVVVGFVIASGNSGSISSSRDLRITITR